MDTADGPCADAKLPTSGPPSKAAAASPAKSGGVGVIGPAWTRGEIEAPAGSEDMGGWQAAVYTPEQQKRLNVDAQGNKLAMPAAASPAKSGGVGVIEPAGTRGEIEAAAAATLEQLDTPCFLVRLPVVARNCSRMAQRAAAAGVSLRPHVKTSVLFCVQLFRCFLETCDR
jgi:hypothetical protein